MLLEGLARETKCDYIVGGYDPPKDPLDQRSYNGAHFYDSLGRKLGVYHKVHLVPYGEFVPMRKQFPFLQNYGIRPVDVIPGTSHDPVDTKIGKVGVSICFESLFGQISRLEASQGAGSLFVITNDSWFLRSRAAQQHMLMSKLRAVETRRWVVRAASTGVSAIIDPHGRTTHTLGIFQRGIIQGGIDPIHTSTVYTRIGDVFAYACVLLAMVSGIFGGFARGLIAGALPLHPGRR